MSIEDLQQGIRLQINRYGYTEIDGEGLRALPFGWLAQQGYRFGAVAGTDTYVIYRPRPRESRWGDGLGELAWGTEYLLDVQRRFNTPTEMDAVRYMVTPDFARRVRFRSRDSYNEWATAQRANGVDVPLAEAGELERSRVDGGDLGVRGDWGDAQPLPVTVQDEAVDLGSVWAVSENSAVRIDNLAVDEPPRTATAAMIEEGTRRALEAARDRYEDNERQLTEMLADRPDHYRVQPGICVCGFAAVFTGDMNAHLAETPLTSPDNGDTYYWKRCERCLTSAKCRRVAVARFRLPSWGGPTTDVPLPENGPTVDYVFHCDSCTRGL